MEKWLLLRVENDAAVRVCSKLCRNIARAGRNVDVCLCLCLPTQCWPSIVYTKLFPFLLPSNIIISSSTPRVSITNGHLATLRNQQNLEQLQQHCTNLLGRENLEEKTWSRTRAYKVNPCLSTCKSVQWWFICACLKRVSVSETKGKMPCSLHHTLVSVRCSTACVLTTCHA